MGDEKMSGGGSQPNEGKGEQKVFGNFTILKTKGCPYWVIAVAVLSLVFVIPALCVLMYLIFFFSLKEYKPIWTLVVCAATLVVLFICVTVMVVVCINRRAERKIEKKQRNTSNILLHAYEEIFSKKCCVVLAHGVKAIREEQSTEQEAKSTEQEAMQNEQENKDK